MSFCGVVNASGHFDVDDSGMLDPGQCQYELWNARSNGETRNFLHFGPSCRIGPVELGATYDRYSDPTGRFDLFGPQLKWMFLGDSQSFVSATLSAGVSGNSWSSHKWAKQVVVPVSFLVRRDFLIHTNLGYDWAISTNEKTRRYGVQGEWALNERYTLIAERIRAFESWNTRVGVRYSITPLISVDASAGHSSGSLKNTFVIGFNHEFSR